MSGPDLSTLPDGVQKVAKFLQLNGHLHAPVMLSDAARTAQQAADALGVVVGQIAKTIVFRRKSDDAAVLVVTSGDRRVDERKVEALVCADGTRIGRANAEFVKAKTGFSIGGVSPLAHATPVVLLIDQSLLRFDQIWAAAGHPNAVFQLAPPDLQRITSAPVVDVAVALVVEDIASASAIKLVAARAHNYWLNGQILSPCISVCQMNATTGLCDGCFRTSDEITVWGGADSAVKKMIWQQIAGRIEQQIVAVSF